MIWPFIPQHGPQESLSWATDTIRAYSSEQRITLSDAPRQGFEFAYLLDAQQYSRAKALAYANLAFDLPIWTDAIAIGTWPSGQQTLTISKDYADFREEALLIQDDLTYQVIDVTETGFDAGSPTAITYSPAYIVPLVPSYMTRGMDSSREHPTHTLARVAWATLESVDLSDTDFDTYRDYPVMTDRAVVMGSFDEAINRAYDLVDNGLAPPFIDSIRSEADQKSVAAWSLSNRADLWRVRQWLHTCKGKAKAFWMPTWSNDLVLTDDIESADTVLHVEAIGYPTSYTLRHVMILKTNGSRVYLRVTEGEAETGGEVLTLSAAVGQNILASDVQMICFLQLMRFASDEFTISYRPGGADLSAVVQEVPQ